MSRLLEVAQLGQPILRQKAKVVRHIVDEKVQELIADMTATVFAVNGVGISAPQVYQPLRIFIMASHPNPRYPSAPEMTPTAMINPKIVSHSKTTEKDWEGCLSVPGIRALVPRWKKVRVTYYTKDGKKVVTTYTSFLAKIFQHELDHLNGIIFLDRIETSKDICTEKEYQKMITKKVA
jgi:peptide deformylase